MKKNEETRVIVARAGSGRSFAHEVSLSAVKHIADNMVKHGVLRPHVFTVEFFKQSVASAYRAFCRTPNTAGASLTPEQRACLAAWNEHKAHLSPALEKAVADACAAAEFSVLRDNVGFSGGAE